MKTIAVVSQKGGAGKTTLALHIAVAAQAAGYGTLLLDMDPQGTAEAWAAWRAERPPVVLAAKVPTLGRVLQKGAEAGAGIAVIDTPPLADAEARTAAQAADLVLVPCRPNAFDLHAIRVTRDLVRFAARPAFVVFNAGPPLGASLYRDTGAVVDRMGLVVAPVRLSDRAAFRHATGSGQAAQEVDPDGKGAVEIAALWQWICQQVDIPTRHHVITPSRKRVRAPQAARL